MARLPQPNGFYTQYAHARDIHAEFREKYARERERRGFPGQADTKICDDGSNDYIRPRMESSSTYRCPRLLRMITSPQSSRENLSLYFSANC